MVSWVEGNVEAWSSSVAGRLGVAMFKLVNFFRRLGSPALAGVGDNFGCG